MRDLIGSFKKALIITKNFSIKEYLYISLLPILLLLRTSLLTLSIESYIYSILYKSASNHFEGTPSDSASVSNKALSIVGVSLLHIIILFGIIIFTAITIIIAILSSPSLIIIILLLLSIKMFILYYICMQFVLPFVIIKDLTVSDGLSHSYRFVKNNFTSVIIFTLLKIIFMIVSLSLSLVITSVILVLLGSEPSQLDTTLEQTSLNKYLIIMYLLIAIGGAITFSVAKVYKLAYIKEKIE